MFQSANTSTTPTPEENNHPIVEEGKISVIEEEKILVGTPSISEASRSGPVSPDDSPDNGSEFVYSSKITKFIRTSAPIPIGQVFFF